MSMYGPVVNVFLVMIARGAISGWSFLLRIRKGIRPIRSPCCMCSIAVGGGLSFDCG